MDRSLHGDRAAFGELFERHAAAIRRLAGLLLSGGHSIDDVVQETFMRGLARIETYRGEAEPRAWLVSIAHNLCRHLHRDRAGREEPLEAKRLEGGRPIGGPGPGVLDSVLGRERGRLLESSLECLSEPQRNVFLLHYREGLPYEDIARILEITPGAARALSHRARAVLRDRIGPGHERAR